MSPPERRFISEASPYPRRRDESESDDEQSDISESSASTEEVPAFASTLVDDPGPVGYAAALGSEASPYNDDDSSDSGASPAILETDAEEDGQDMEDSEAATNFYDVSLGESDDESQHLKVVGGLEALAEWSAVGIQNLPDIVQDSDTSAQRPLRFDDIDAEYLSSDSESEWDKVPFDHDVILEALRSQAVPVEPLSGSTVLRARMAREARHVRRVIYAMAFQSQALRVFFLGLYYEGLGGTELFVRVSWLIAQGLERRGVALAGEAQRMGENIGRMLLELWPALFFARGQEGWLERVVELVEEAMMLVPAMDQYAGLARGRWQ